MKMDHGEEEDLDLYNDDLYNEAAALYRGASTLTSPTTSPTTTKPNPIDGLNLYQEPAATTASKEEEEEDNKKGKSEDAMSIDETEDKNNNNDTTVDDDYPSNHYDFSRYEKFWCIIYTKKGSLEVMYMYIICI